MKSKAFVLVFTAIIAISLLFGCADNKWIDVGGSNDDFSGEKLKGNGNIISQERMVKGFTGITLTGAGNVNIHHDADYKVIVTTDDNLQGLIATAINGNILNIQFVIESNNKKVSISPTKLTIDVYMPLL